MCRICVHTDALGPAFGCGAFGNLCCDSIRSRAGSRVQSMHMQCRPQTGPTSWCSNPTDTAVGCNLRMCNWLRDPPPNPVSIPSVHVSIPSELARSMVCRRTKRREDSDDDWW